MRTKPKIIFYAPILEYPPAGGPQISVCNAVKVLNNLSELHIITTVPQWRLNPEARRFFESRCHSLVHAPSSRWAARNNSLDTLLRRSKRVAAPLFAKPDVDFIVGHAARNGIDIFWIDRVLEHAFQVFKQLRQVRPHSPIVGDTEAVHSRFILRELPLVTNSLRRSFIGFRGRRTEREERELTALADIVTAVSQVDVDYFRSIAPDPGRIRQFSNTVDLNDYVKNDHSQIRFRCPFLLLLGSFGDPNSPMDRAARWVAKDVMPLVWREVPDASLYIVGRNADLTQSELNSDLVTVVGKVPSVLPFLHQAAATLVPLRFESGTRFKILESGAASIPCISTTLGAEGLEVTDGEDIIIADTTEGFAEGIVKVLKMKDLAASLGRRLHDLVARSYSLEAQEREGDSIIRSLRVGFSDPAPLS